MEELKMLEMVQKMLLFIESNGLSSSHHDSDRFLAHFLLFMIQPCGALNMKNRRCLISENLPKISAAVLEKALSWINGEGTLSYYSFSTLPFSDSQRSCFDFPQQLDAGDKCDFSPLAAGKGNMAMIGYDAMQQANSSLEDFCRSYFMFHGMDGSEPHLIFKFLPALSFTESYIYQLDRLNEEMLSLPVDCHAHGRDNQTLCHCCQEHKLWLSSNFLNAFNSDPFKCLVLQLEHLGLLTERIRRELEYGAEYWALERKLCHALAGKEEILIEEVMRAIHLKSFDYRVLNLLLYQLREQQVEFQYQEMYVNINHVFYYQVVKVNDLHMEFLSISEFLVEVSDDLFDYEDDIIENNFNILRMFVGIYGASMAPKMLAKCIAEAEEKYNHLLDALDPEISLKYKRRCEEATKEGGQTSAHPMGTWTIPPVIANEDSYRSHLFSSNSTAKPT